MLLSKYQQLVTDQHLTKDSQQDQACLALDRVRQRLEQSNTAANIYLYGPVGRGKSMLMDLFYQTLESSQKVRLHYHHFMQKVHQELNQRQGESDPMEQVAASWAAQFRVICLDEFIVEDIGDAMILATLWQALFKCGVSLVTTSNSPPNELYRGGLARHRFEPFIRLLEQQCHIQQLDNGIDFRRLGAGDMPFYLVNVSSDALCEVAEQQFGPITPLDQLTVMNRSMQPMWHNAKIIGFDFWQLCSGPRSQRDYMELADRYSALAVANVPAFTFKPDTTTAQGIEDSYQRDHYPSQLSTLDNEARRFIALVDECYDRGCQLLISAEVEVDQLYQAKQLQFPFQRCVSRLVEMQRW